MKHVLSKGSASLTVAALTMAGATSVQASEWHMIAGEESPNRGSRQSPGFLAE